MSDYAVTFELISGILTPCLPVAPDGTARSADGVRYLSCDQVAERLGATPEAVCETYAAFLHEVGTGSRGAKQVEDANATLRRRMAHLSDQHFAEFTEICRLKGFNPWGKHVWTDFKMGKSGRMELVVMLSADGFYAVALRTGQVQKIVGPEWCGPDGRWVDVWTDTRMPAAARVGIQRRGVAEPVYAVARWESYAPFTMGARGERTYDDFWMKMPDFMLGKCAGCLAIRRVFSDCLDGIYSPEEMAQSRNPDPHDDGEKPPAPDWVPLAVEDMPQTAQAFHLALMDCGLGTLAGRNAAIEVLRKELAMVYASNIAAFYAKAVARVRANPVAYGAEMAVAG